MEVIKPYIAVQDGIGFGNPTIKGTRIYPETIYDYYLGGEPKKFIAELFGLTLPQVEAAIRYCKNTL